MAMFSQTVQHPTLIPADEGVFIAVPWDRAEHFQEVLRREGIGSILHLDPRERQARLEPRTNLGGEQLLALLGDTANGHPVPRPQAAGVR